MLTLTLYIVLTVIGLQFIVLGYLIRYRLWIKYFLRLVPNVQDINGLARWVGTNLFVLGIASLVTLVLELYITNITHLAYFAFALLILPTIILSIYYGSGKFMRDDINVA